MNSKKIVEALTSNAKCTYEFDVTTGKIFIKDNQS